MRRSRCPSQLGKNAAKIPLRTLAQDEEEVNVKVRRWKVMYNGRITTKKVGKTYQRDGWLELKDNRIKLWDDDGFFVCDTLYIVYMRLDDDCEVIVDDKEVKILRELVVEDQPERERPLPPAIDHRRPLPTLDTPFRPPLRDSEYGLNQDHVEPKKARVEPEDRPLKPPSSPFSRQRANRCPQPSTSGLNPYIPKVLIKTEPGETPVSRANKTPKESPSAKPLVIKKEPQDDTPVQKISNPSKNPISGPIIQDVVIKTEPQDDTPVQNIIDPSKNPVSGTSIQNVVIKQEPQDPDPDTPLERHEMVIFCRFSPIQIKNYEQVYEDQEDGDDLELFMSDLQSACNGPIKQHTHKVSGKLQVLRGIVKGALQRKESVLVVCEEREVTSNLLPYAEGQFGDATVVHLTEEQEAQELAAGEEGRPKLIISTVDHLELIVKHNLTFPRTILYERPSPERRPPADVLAKIAVGPKYHLLIMGSLEERMFQMEHLLTEDKCEMLLLPGDYNALDTHKLLKCNCHAQEDEQQQQDNQLATHELNANWVHIPGTSVLQRKADYFHKLHLPTESLSSIGFIFKRRLSPHSSFSR